MIGFTGKGFALLALRLLIKALIHEVYREGEGTSFFGTSCGRYSLDTHRAFSSSKIGRLGATVNRGGVQGA